MEYRDVVGYEGYYLVYEDGRVYSIRSKRFLKQFPHQGYYQVKLCVNYEAKNFLVHRLVAEAFLPNPDNLPCVNHKKEADKLDNHVTNLEWCSYEYNINYGTANERRSQKLKNNQNSRRRPIIQYSRSGEYIGEYPSIKSAGTATNTREDSICRCARGKAKTAGGFIWKYKEDLGQDS